MKTETLSPQQLDQYYAKQNKVNNLIQWTAIFIVASIVVAFVSYLSSITVAI